MLPSSVVLAATLKQAQKTLCIHLSDFKKTGNFLSIAVSQKINAKINMLMSNPVYLYKRFM